ncbi:hypothetical protein FB451DRAFT_267004 [Mycena latifolia]|nr:hypothetical protein FB451DRAFT_267004 [Mycena latifolia]
MLTPMDPSPPPPPKLRKCGCKCLPNCKCPCTCRAHCSCLGEKCVGTCDVNKTRNLVVSIDGTSNQFGIYNTHVLELHKHIRKDDPKKKQLSFYVSGIGTYAPPSFWSVSSWKQWMFNNIDLAIAWNFEQQVQDAYRWLADNYKPGDKIFLFGFSRGAYQVRALAGMIEKMGLIYSGNHRLIPFAYELYTKHFKGKDTPEAERLCENFKATLSRKIGPENKDDVRVHFVGAWDTVSSVGLFVGQPLPLTTSADHICIFRHALALDECRVRFMPEYINRGDSQTSENLEIAKDDGSSETSSTSAPANFPERKQQPTPDGDATGPEAEGLSQQRPSGTKGATKPEDRVKDTDPSKQQLPDTKPDAKRKRCDIKEVWFAGTHSDMKTRNSISAVSHCCGWKMKQAMPALILSRGAMGACGTGINCGTMNLPSL